ncbi:MAG: bud emergence protein 1 [Bathelium mastoideum]|nr:MAG: bud emergence protein 1 [Bathelium mastoideum]
MVKFRRSIKSQDGVKSPHISIPQKDAIAIVPPKKVIKALYTYQVPNPEQNSGQLSFTEGDFLHVVSRENDPDWYEACNPLHGTRGLVPVKYFEPVGKTVRDSGGSATSIPTGGIPGHDSGYAESSKNGSRGSVSGSDGEPKSARLSKTLGKGSGAMVYGIVQYDFKAERPDELEAKEGEAIIVIAQSNPEWFVAKPITRLGGPGLIPVSFIEIRDMSTGKAVPDAQEAVTRAGVPKVEEWKKLAADYKNSSIPLGRLDAQTQMQQGMSQMTLSNGNPQETNGYAPATSLQHQRSQSQTYQQPYRQEDSVLACMRASVPRYCYADDNFWFIVDAVMEDGREWELSRFYTDFYDLQINLIREFPVEAGNTKQSPRTLPYMPGPVNYVTDNISNGRRANLDTYLKELFKLGPHISQCYLVRKFFAPRHGDYEIDPDAPTADENGYRLSGASSHSQDLNNAATSRQSSHANGNGYLNGYGQQQAPYNPYQSQHQRNQQSYSSTQHYRTPSDLHPSSAANGNGAPPMLRNNSALTQRSATSSTSTANAAGPGPGAALSQPSTTSLGQPVKIKVWFQADHCVVIRMPPQFSYEDLRRKLEERRRMEGGGQGLDDGEMAIDYKDDTDGEYYRIENDNDLVMALERCPKLTLMVSAE